jgi:serine phosphatase RsbU (regulator of sigma subunit)
LDCSTREFTYARAGHPLPLLLDGNNQPVKIPQKCGQAIGLFDPIQLDEQQVVLPEDGTLLIFSDGLSESIGESLKSPKLAGLCADFMHKERVGSQTLCEYLFRVSAGSSHLDQLKDDFTVVAIRSEKW